MSREPMPWVTTRDELVEREEHAAGLVGATIAAVRYFTIDDRDAGARLVVDVDEWAEPIWRHATFDAIDCGVELDTLDGRTYGAIWEQAGDNAGLALRQESLLEKRLAPHGNFAIWDVTSTSRWTVPIRNAMTRVDLHWSQPSVRSGLCCEAITLSFGAELVHLVLADADQRGELIGSDDNVAVLDDAVARRLGAGSYRAH